MSILKKIQDSISRAIIGAYSPQTEWGIQQAADDRELDRIMNRPASKYQSLLFGQTILEGDELLDDDCITWRPVGDWCKGLPYQPNSYRPMRRLVIVK